MMDFDVAWGAGSPFFRKVNCLYHEIQANIFVYLKKNNIIIYTRAPSSLKS